MKKRMLIFLWLIGITSGYAQSKPTIRERININKDWDFYYEYDVRTKPFIQKVDLPHTWNAKDVFDGKFVYNRTLGIYQHKIFADPLWKEKRVFLYFEGANSVADVFINKKFITEHKGGYTAFCVEITNQLKVGKENQIMVQVSNAARQDVLPLSGDFNIYGGLHRSVWLMVTNKNCITPLDYAFPGVYIQQNITENHAMLNILTKLSLTKYSSGTSIRTIIKDASQTEVARVQNVVKNVSAITQKITINNPHLWNGRKNPYLYHVTVQLLQNNQVIDEVEQPLGLRYFKVDADAGFFLNGKYLDLYGFGRHEDVAGKGSALTPADQEKDMSLITQSGATAMRLTHYPQSSYFYDLADKNGIILWSEIPLVGPGGYTGTGYVNDLALQQQARQLLTELIRQYYNHPSICFWGLFNELKLDYDNPIHFIAELNALVKKEDPSRITTCATFLDTDAYNKVSDVIAWNKYYGWYSGTFAEIGDWADQMHQKFPHKPIAVSEYGAGANIEQHSTIMKAPDPSGNFHFEEWQTAFHEANWAELNKRKFIWGKFAWVLCDFGSSIRSEGGFNGLNDKGLVTYDRKIKKDAFYFYQANWSDAPMLHLTEKRNTLRNDSLVTVKAYTNLGQAELYVNDKSFGKKSTDSLHRVIWNNVKLARGNNHIEVRAINNKEVLKDSCDWLVRTVSSPVDNKSN